MILFTRGGDHIYKFSQNVFKLLGGYIVILVSISGLGFFVWGIGWVLAGFLFFSVSYLFKLWVGLVLFCFLFISILGV